MPPTATIQLRLAELEDVDIVRDLQRRSFAHLGASFYPAQILQSAVEYVCRPDLQIIRDGTYFVATQNQRVVGCGGWSARRREFAGPADAAGDDAPLVPGQDAARIRAMFVDPAVAGNGVGRLILRHCETAASEAGFTQAELGATLSGEGFYAGQGYVERSRLTTTLEDGTPMEVVMMTKALCSASDRDP